MLEEKHGKLTLHHEILAGGSAGALQVRILVEFCAKLKGVCHQPHGDSEIKDANSVEKLGPSVAQNQHANCKGTLAIWFLFILQCNVVPRCSVFDGVLSRLCSFEEAVHGRQRTPCLPPPNVFRLHCSCCGCWCGDSLRRGENKVCRALLLLLLTVSRLQKGGGEKLYKSVRYAFVKIYREEGFRALYKGAGIRSGVIGTLFSVTMWANEKVKQFLIASGKI